MNTSVQKLLKGTSLEELAIRSNIGYGKAIFKRGGVEIVLKTDAKVEAWVGGLSGDSKSGGGTRRHVWFYSKQSKFSWHCSGNPKDHDIFCKHCVALAYRLLK
ncbi:MAG TPA: hypothetical protein VFG51_02510 [Candidatus Saccharimonadia bacterium]|nr:hypothetical protein [Candidatus Saccharimonadia bacterium]